MNETERLTAAEKQIAALENQLCIAGTLFGALFGILQSVQILAPDDVEALFAQYSMARNPLNNAFMDRFRMGLDKALGPDPESDLTPPRA